MKTVQCVGEEVAFHGFHRLGEVQTEDGARHHTMKVKRSRGRSHIAVNCEAVEDMLEDGSEMVLVDDRERFLFLPLTEFKNVLTEHGKIQRPSSGSYWLIDHNLLPEEAQVQMGPHISEEKSSPPKSKVDWTQFKFADADRAFEEVRDGLGMASTFYNPTTARLLKELPAEFDLVMIDRSENTIWLGRKN